jgi:arylsulfatase A-like enzyme
VINTEDLMPTLLGLSGLSIPSSVEGLDFSGYIRGGRRPGDGAALLACIAPFGQWTRRVGGREYRGLRTERHTYVRDLNGPWLLFDNVSDPFQERNLVGSPKHTKLQARLEPWLQRKLAAAGDQFLPARDYLQRWTYEVDATGTVPYTP